MRFEVVNALRNLDERTPAFYMSELFSHGELKLKIVALEALKDLDPEDETSHQLRSMLDLI
jgi:hypothetical protein